MLSLSNRKEEDLTSPLSNPTKRQDDGYSQLGRNIPRFLSVNALPIKLDSARLDDGSGIEDTSRRNNAQYHATCRLLFSNTKLQQAEKRSALVTAIGDSSNKNSKVPRRMIDPKMRECSCVRRKGRRKGKP